MRQFFAPESVGLPKREPKPPKARKKKSRKHEPRKKPGPRPFADYEKFTPVNAVFEIRDHLGNLVVHVPYTRNHLEKLWETYSQYGSKKVYHTFGYRKIKIRYWEGDITHDQGTSKTSWSGGIVNDSAYTLDGHYSGQHVEWRQWSQTVYNTALGKYYQQLRNAETQLSVDLIEMGKTREMMFKRIKDVIRIARAARKGNFLPYQRRRKRRPGENPDDAWHQTMSKTWLEWKYGWSPTLSTIFDCVNFQRTKAHKFRVEGKYAKKGTFAYRDGIQGYTDNLPVLGHLRYVYACRIRGDYAVRDRAYFDASRLSPLNPATIIWELVPYSFVVDWFIDIGGYLQNLETAYGVGLTFLSGYETQLFVIRANATIPAGARDSNSFGNTWYTTGGLSSSLHEARRRRLRLETPPIPHLPKFEPKLGWQRLISGAALLNQILTKRPRSNI
jgi:hypothetical protein